MKRTIAKYPERYRARIEAAKALKRGELVRPSACQECGHGNGDTITMHHPDYDRPLRVQWLCRKCHAKADQQRRALAERGRKPRVKTADIKIPKPPSVRPSWMDRPRGFRAPKKNTPLEIIG